MARGCETHLAIEATTLREVKRFAQGHTAHLPSEQAKLKRIRSPEY